MSDEVVVNPEVLERDAEQCWQAWSDKLAAMSAVIPALLPTDFSAIPGFDAFPADYATSSGALRDYLDGGAKEFLLFEHALLNAVLAYDRSHNATIADIARIEKELQS